MVRLNRSVLNPVATYAALSGPHPARASRAAGSFSHPIWDIGISVAGRQAAGLRVGGANGRDGREADI